MENCGGGGQPKAGVGGVIAMLGATEGMSHRPAAWQMPFASFVATLEAEQERWFLWLPVLYGTGIAIYFALDREPALLAALAPVPAALALRFALIRGTLAVVAAGAILSLACGFAAAKIRTVAVAGPTLDRQIGPVEVRGYMELVEPRPTRGQRLTIRVTKIERLPAERTPWRIRVRTLATTPGLQPGDAIRVRATLAAPGLPTMPGDYDFARAAFFSSIGAVGYALRRAERDPEAGPAPWGLQAAAVVAQVRQAIGARVTAALPGERGAIANALITGERGGISEATNAAYRDSGLFHILSISGLHMTVMAGAVFFAIRALLAAIPAFALRLEIKKWAAATAIVAAFGYLLISGAQFATVRSWIMITIMLLAVLLDRPAIAMRNVALGALAILVAMPESLFDAGFQMSFAAVLALVAAFEAIRDRLANRRVEHRGVPRWLGIWLFFGGIILTTLIASLAVAPFSVYLFHKSQQYAIIANLIAIPVCNIVTMPAALATLVVMPFGVEQLPLWVMGLGIDVMGWCAATVARLPGAVTALPAIPTLSFALMIVGGLWLCIWRLRWRLLGLALIGAGLATAPMRDRPDILVGNDGRALAARIDGRMLSAPPGHGGNFELSRWLENDGDMRDLRQVQGGREWRCDAIGCTATMRGLIVALARHPAALADDCLRADILVVTFPRPRTCEPHRALIDLYDLRDRGTHALYVTDNGVRIDSVGASRGSRPWTRASHAEGLRLGTTADNDGSRLSAFAAPYDLADDADLLRPEVEDEDWNRQ
jgi:competence protein ComEC